MSAHIDRFVSDRLPELGQQPTFAFDGLNYPDSMNAARILLDERAAQSPDAPCLLSLSERWTYVQTRDQVNRIAHVLVDDLHVIPGNCVLLRGPNSPMLAACWLAVLKVGAIAVTTMPLYRQQELRTMIDKAEVEIGLCDTRFLGELQEATAEHPSFVCLSFGEEGSLEDLMRDKPTAFDAVQTSATDPAIIAFTSGTTGVPKAAVHTHRDLLATCDTFGAQVLRPRSSDVFCGSPPLGFTFGLGGLLLFPLHVGASTVLLEKAGPSDLISAIASHQVTTLFTAPVAYRAMCQLLDGQKSSSLRQCVSAGEPLALPIWEEWHRRTGVKIIDGIGSTEMLHIFIACDEANIRPGSTGRPVPGYRAEIHDEYGATLPANTIGRLAVIGPTGCTYLDDSRQRTYVQNGWNYPGDTYRMDEDGYFWYVARSDDMIISAGYNISGPEVEEALLAHSHVRECAVVAKPDPAHHTHVVKAYVVLDER
ncbi:MAG: AMP-binding protein, partial [Vulcanimicrobiaceae bacterium]